MKPPHGVVLVLPAAMLREIVAAMPGRAPKKSTQETLQQIHSDIAIVAGFTTVTRQEGGLQIV